MNLTLILGIASIAFLMQGCEDKGNPGCDSTRRAQIEGCEMSAVGRAKEDWQFCSTVNLVVQCYTGCCGQDAHGPDGKPLVDEETGQIVTLESQMMAALKPFSAQ